MDSGDIGALSVLFGIVMIFLVSIRDRLKRIEEKLDRLGK